MSWHGETCANKGGFSHYFLLTYMYDDPFSPIFTCLLFYISCDMGNTVYRKCPMTLNKYTFRLDSSPQGKLRVFTSPQQFWLDNVCLASVKGKSCLHSLCITGLGLECCDSTLTLTLETQDSAVPGRSRQKHLDLNPLPPAYKALPTELSSPILAVSLIICQHPS